MIGLVILAVAAGWVALWLYVFKHAPNRFARVGAVLAAILIPFWDLPIGYLQYRYLCSTDGGIRVHEPFRPQDKIYFDLIPSNTGRELLKQGFKVVEVQRADGKGIVRQEIQEGTFVSKTVASPESAIALSVRPAERLSWNIDRETHIAHSLSTSHVLATYTAFSWYGGWLQEALRPLVQGKLKCSLGSDPLVALLRSGS